MRQWRQFGFPIGTILAFFFFYLQVIPMLLTKWSLFQEKKRKINFQDGGRGGHLGFPIGTRISENRFQDGGSGEEAKKRFSRLRQWRPVWIFHRNNLAVLYLQVTPMLLTKFHVKWSLFQKKKRKINFQDGGHGDHLGIFDWNENKRK